MSDPYLSMIEAFGFNFAPMGWATCAGQTLSIAQNQALFALLGTTYGGNGTTTFNLPDLRGRLALGFGQGLGLSSYPLGAAGGQETHLAESLWDTERDTDELLESDTDWLCESLELCDALPDPVPDAESESDVRPSESVGPAGIEIGGFWRASRRERRRRPG